MTIDQLRYFLEIVNTGSFSQASKNLFVSQPNISYSIKNLETELGFSIFQKDKKGIAVTQKGKELIPFAKKIIDTTEYIKHMNSDLSEKTEKLSVSHQFIFSTINPISSVIDQSEPPIELSLHQCPFLEVIKNVSTGISSIGIVYVNETNQKIINRILYNHSLKFTPLTNVKLCYSVAQNHPLFSEKDIYLGNLLDYPLVTCNFAEKNDIYSEVIKLTLFAEFKQKFFVQDLFSQYLFMEKHNAIGLNIKYSFYDFYELMNKHNMKIRLIETSNSPTITIGYIKNNDTNLTYIEQQFVNALFDFYRHENDMM